MWDKQVIHQQIVSRKSISRNTAHRQSLNLIQIGSVWQNLLYDMQMYASNKTTQSIFGGEPR